LRPLRTSFGGCTSGLLAHEEPGRNRPSPQHK
jgi:hypothetical protein